jgi:hypothetical protein
LRQQIRRNDLNKYHNAAFELLEVHPTTNTAAKIRNEVADNLSPLETSICKSITSSLDNYSIQRNSW